MHTIKNTIHPIDNLRQTSLNVFLPLSSTNVIILSEVDCENIIHRSGEDRLRSLSAGIIFIPVKYRDKDKFSKLYRTISISLHHPTDTPKIKYF